MKIALGCDHGGFVLKEAVKAHLAEQGIETRDFGCHSKDSVDYAPIAAKAGRCVAGGDADFGILICSTGLGISMAANKVKGIRAAACTDEFCATMTRRHNNANVLCMGAMVVDEPKALQLVDIFLSTAFDGDTPEGARHRRRVEEIAMIEEGRL